MPRRCGTRASTPSGSGTRSSSRSSRANPGVGAMSTNPTSKPSPAEPGDITETPDLQGAYPRLSDAQIAALTSQGDRRGTQPRDILFGEGKRDCDFYVVLGGHVASVEGHGTDEERVISVHGRGRFLGELSLLTGE